jgi:hypothetical protein
MSIRFYALNQVYESIMTASSENAQFPVDNIKEDRRTKVFRTTSSSGDIVMDFGGSVDIDSFMVVPHSSDGFGISTLTLELNATNDWVSPAVSQVITLDTTFNVGSFEWSTIQSYRFARLVFTSTLTYCEIANIFIGKRVEFQDNDITYPISYKQVTRRNESENRYGQKFIDEINTQKVFSGSINTMTLAEIDQLLEMLDFNAITRPVFVAFESSSILNDVDRLNGMYYLAADPQLEFDQGNYWNISLSFEEAL